jgi:3-oxoacyl-[acyl-carrier protein] reductase
MASKHYTLEGKVALITGSGRGIGKGIAIELGSRGASIVLNYANTPPEAAIKEIEAVGGKAFAIKADVTKVPEIKRLFKEAIAHFGHLDIVMSNSGTESFKPEEEVTEEDYDRIFALNTRAQFFVAQQGLINLKEGGRIIMTSSIAAGMTGVPNHALYAGSKCAVEGFTRSFAKDCGHKRITVNAIAPGGVMSDMFHQNAWHYAPGATQDWPVEKLEAGLASVCPLGRVAYPVDIARIVAFLAHSDSEWINGQVLQVNGGGK